MNSPTYRFSYSMLSSWARGDWDRAIASFLRIPYVDENDPDSEKRMAAGKKWHNRWEREIKQTGRMPVVFGGEELKHPLIEGNTKRERMLNDWLQFVGVLDLQDMPMITDHKLSKNNATYWANTFQPNCYQVLYPGAKIFRFNCLNPYLKEDNPDRVSVSIIHLSDKTLRDGVEWILTHASEMRNYMETNNLLKGRVIHGQRYS